MKLVLAPALAATAFLAAAAVLPARSAGQAPSQSSAPAQPQEPVPGSGKVIFSRSTDAEGQTSTQVGPGAPAAQPATEPSVDDNARRAVTFTALDLDVHLETSAHRIAVRAQLTVRNDGAAPLARIPLQISSSLNWERIRVVSVNGPARDVSFPVATLNSDADHTGQLHEAAVPLAQPLAPGASVSIDATYSGLIEPSSQRLASIGAPDELARRSDWDQIDPAFTGLRGFGNVVWYPVSSVPQILGDGARLFEEIGRHKLHLSGARFGLRLAVEFPHGEAPTVALVNGLSVPLAVTDTGTLDPSLAGVATARLPAAVLGFTAPSLFVAVRKLHTGVHLAAFPTTDDEVNVQKWQEAATSVQPFLEDWLGSKPRTQLTLLDLPDPGDTPFETGSLVVSSLADQNEDHLAGILVHGFTHAWIGPAPRPAWLDEGLAAFIGTLWVEKKHGRDQALETLEADRSALALAEPSSPGQGEGQPLVRAIDPVYYRSKASYVLWMLRDLAGDDHLAAALRAYDSASPETSSLSALLKANGVARDLSWLFADWIDADKGLPDLAIQSVFPNAAQSGTWLVAVNVSNAGYAAADVPVTVRSALTTITDRILVPARGTAIQRLLINGKPTSVTVNDGSVPETEASVHVENLDRTPTVNPDTPPGSSTSQPAEPPADAVPPADVAPPQ